MIALVLLGPQGSGKGTQAKRIAAEYGIPHVSTGEIFRAAIADGTELGRRVEPILRAGELVPDELTAELVRERLAQDDARAGFVLDGFPRTLAQAEALDDVLRELGRELDLVLELQLPEAVAVERLLRRAEEQGRDDDNPESIRTRLALYRENTAPLVEHYRARGVVVGIHAAGTIPEVFAEVQDAIEQAAARTSA